MEIASIPDQSLAECLQLLEKQFDIHSLVEKVIDRDSMLDYYRQSGRGYRLFHCREGSMHVALNRGEKFSKQGYLGQVELIEDRLRSNSVRNVLEVGCGVGFNTRHLSSRMKDCCFRGIDLSEEHVRMASEKSSEAKNLEFAIGDFQAIDSPDSSFDAVFAVETLCQATDTRLALEEIFRVLRPGGQLLVIDCFRGEASDPQCAELELAARLVEKTMAVEKFVGLGEWFVMAKEIGFADMETMNLSSDISHNLARFHRLARRFLKMPKAARAFLKAFPPRLLQNSISGLLMPFTVGSGVHQYHFCELNVPGS